MTLSNELGFRPDDGILLTYCKIVPIGYLEGAGPLYTTQMRHAVLYGGKCDSVPRSPEN